MVFNKGGFNAPESVDFTLLHIGLQDIAAQVLVGGQFTQLLIHIGGIHINAFTASISCLVGEVLQQPLHHGMQTTGPDILSLLIRTTPVST